MSAVMKGGPCALHYDATDGEVALWLVTQLMTGLRGYEDHCLNGLAYSTHSTSWNRLGPKQKQEVALAVLENTPERLLAEVQVEMNNSPAMELACALLAASFQRAADLFSAAAEREEATPGLKRIDQ